MALWTLRDYVDENGVNQPRDWYHVQDDAAKAACRDVLGLIVSRPIWRRSRLYHDLEDEHRGLGEIRIPLGSKDDPGFRRFRYFGLRNQLRREFLIFVSFEKFLHGATNPIDAEALALVLKAAHEQKKGTVVLHEYH